MKRADKSRAEFALLLGEQELTSNQVGLKPLRSGEEQQSVAMSDLVATLRQKISS